MNHKKWLAVAGCFFLLMGCEGVKKALNEGGPEYRAGPQPIAGGEVSNVEVLANKVNQMESDQAQLERAQLDLEQQRDRLKQEISALNEELKAMRAGVVVPPPPGPRRAAPPEPRKPSAAKQPMVETPMTSGKHAETSPAPHMRKPPAEERPQVAAIPQKPRTPIDPEASKKALREGIELSRQGKYKAAEENFLRAIELDPTNGKAHYALGFVFNEQNQVDRALESFKKAINIDPRDAKAHYGLGYVYDEKGLYDEAIVEFKKAIELNPNEARAHYNLGVIYEKKGMKEEAMDSFYWSLVGRGGLLTIGRRELVVVALTVLFIVFGCRSRTLRSEFQAGHTLSGIASWYGKEFNGKPTASGMTYDMYDLTAAHRTLPFGTMVEVRNLNNAERVVVEINDRGPFVKGRIIDLSYEAARKLGIVEDGTAPVDLRLLLLGDVDKKRLKYRVQVGSFADWTNARELQNRDSS
jgi:tetratricopeptide (TPR) repeat protein